MQLPCKQKASGARQASSASAFLSPGAGSGTGSFLPAASSSVVAGDPQARMGKRVAVVLAGCGVFDGSEIHEASAVLVHLSRAGAEVKIFAPNIEQMHVVDHLKGCPSEEKRNVLVESARLARGDIQDLAELKVGEFDAIIFPVLQNHISIEIDSFHLLSSSLY
uniref:DJ-1/PfpI domain-containing protein n=1 Tax=Podarcis muralis TaxID=64176 RepID=A0A670IIR9_PODMU